MKKRLWKWNIFTGNNRMPGCPIIFLGFKTFRKIQLPVNPLLGCCIRYLDSNCCHQAASTKSKYWFSFSNTRIFIFGGIRSPKKINWRRNTVFPQSSVKCFGSFLRNPRASNPCNTHHHRKCHWGWENSYLCIRIGRSQPSFYIRTAPCMGRFDIHLYLKREKKICKDNWTWNTDSTIQAYASTLILSLNTANPSASTNLDRILQVQAL